jgi:hypothetical protein
VKSISIIGCADSAQQWDGQGISIGVNDCWKFGKPTTFLVCVNGFRMFDKQRLKTIVNSAPEKFYSSLTVWKEYFNGTFEKIDLRRWKGRVIEQYQSSKTSPFIAISMAYVWGYDHIKIYGVDYLNHKTFSDLNPDTSYFRNEMKNYEELFKQLQKKGITIETTKESYLNKFL